jgi:hypothetical protein
MIRVQLGPVNNFLNARNIFLELKDLKAIWKIMRRKI